MDETLYKLMNWRDIEAIVYSEHDDPHTVLGAHKAKGGMVYTTFDPNAERAILLLGEGG